ncbi:MAG TPA: glycosyltransferase family 87 protein [Anaerolineales bacterium]
MRQSSPGARLLLAIVLIGLAAGLTAANYQFARLAPGGNDFLARWNAARWWLVEGVNPYDPRVSRSSQELIYGRPADPEQGEDIAHFAYPLPSMIFFGPFGLLPYDVARAIWMTMLELGLPLLAAVGLARARWRPGPGMTAAVMVFAIVWYYGSRAIILGQFAVLDAVLIASGLLAFQRRRDVLGGILLALSSVKPQMAFLVIPLVLIWAAASRRKAAITSLVGGLLVLYGGATLLLPNWPILWARQLVDYPRYTSIGSPVSVLFSGLAAGTTLNLVATAGLGLYLLSEWIRAARADDHHFQWTADVTLVITNLIAFRTATTNYVVLLPALCLVFRVFDERWGRTGKAIIGLSMLGLAAGSWALFLATVSGNEESALMYLPLPFLTLSALWWVRWWVIRVSRLRPEGIGVKPGL